MTAVLHEAAFDPLRIARRFIAGAVRRVRDLSGLAAFVPPLGDFPSDSAEALQAWRELRELPELVWIPPLWRPDGDHGTGLARQLALEHAIHALDHNLRIEVFAGDSGQPLVRLTTSPLTDRPTETGVDPLNPNVAPRPLLVGEAETFEEAILSLRAAAHRAWHSSANRLDDHLSGDSPHLIAG